MINEVNMQIGSSVSSERISILASETNSRIASASFVESDTVTIRDRVETYLTSSDKADQSKTWAAHRASGFADFFAQPDFRD
jgi:hypothetical protein